MGGRERGRLVGGLKGVLVSAELVLLNKRQISGGAPKLDCYRLKFPKLFRYTDSFTWTRRIPSSRQC